MCSVTFKPTLNQEWGHVTQVLLQGGGIPQGPGVGTRWAAERDALLIKLVPIPLNLAEMATISQLDAQRIELVPKLGAREVNLS